MCSIISDLNPTNVCITFDISLNNLFFTTSIEGEIIWLEDQEAKHCAQVLRHNTGDCIFVLDGNGSRYECTIESVSKNKVSCRIVGHEFKKRVENITIAIAPTKNRDRLEWMIEKVVEIGVDSIVLMQTINTERTRTNSDRLFKKALSAVKQSLRYYIPDIVEMTFEDVLKIEASEKYIAHCYDAPPKSKVSNESDRSKLILIGPEGDFTEVEVASAAENNFRGLDLGEFRLRTETAAIVAVTMFQ